MSLKFFFILLLFAFGTLAHAQAPLAVAVSSPVIRDLVENIGGSKVKVLHLEESSKDPHNFDPSVKTIQVLQKSALIFLVGGQFEVWSKTVFAQIKSQAKVVSFIDSLSLPGDSHFWLNPELTLKAMDLIEKELAAQIPEQSAEFKKRNELYKKALLELVLPLKKKIALIPVDQKEFVAETESLSHLATYFGFKLVSISQKGHRTEITAQELGKIQKLSREKAFKFYLYETHQPQSVWEQRSRDLKLKPLGPLYIETFAARGLRPQTYLELIESNIKLILSAFP